ncbi:hypothetical protein VTJ49DRAFT_4859 [Mycothermus thermophilus]|uniref:RING-type domain-containing protein n=1 Tax=Humicola insolens TaxID=85995 RepID=A0ABR3V4E0_HUMIN
MAAALTLTEAQAELISSLPQEDIPAKLRCAICSKLAVNAFRLPCCEQAICESCQATLPASCPVCEHSPLSAADCKPHKALRTTIKVFLRTEEKKRESAKPKETSAPVTPVEPTPTVAAVPSAPEAGVETAQPDRAVEEQAVAGEKAQDAEATEAQEGHDAGAEEERGVAENGADAVRQSIAVCCLGPMLTQTGNRNLKMPKMLPLKRRRPNLSRSMPNPKSLRMALPKPRKGKNPKPSRTNQTPRSLERRPWAA